MANKLLDKNEGKSLRFGGISPVVLRELSGVYQPFVKAVKELISNAYDADAPRVDLSFVDNFQTLVVKDYGCGMDPIEFVREYIRIGKGTRKTETTPSGRPRIGGKGIGFLAPARYCEKLEVKTKKGITSEGVMWIDTQGETRVDVKPYLLQGHGFERLLGDIHLVEVRDKVGEVIVNHFEEDGFVFELEQPYEDCLLVYEFNSTRYELTATLDFDLLFSLESSKSLEEIENFCEIQIREVEEQEIDKSYTAITLLQVKEFVQNELLVERKKGARNVENYSGIEQFLWNLSRIIPVKAKIHENIPEKLGKFIQTELDQHSIEVFCSYEYEQQSKPLERFLIQPSKKLDFQSDADIVRQLDFRSEQIDAVGFLIGQSSTIFPAECRGILLRVKGVAIGEPTYFGLDQTLTGSAKIALGQISGEINILSGIDAIHDINPGRDGFYKESPIYNAIKNLLIGESGKLSGYLKEVMYAIIDRSEINASIGNFVKKYDAQRRAIYEASMAVSELSYEDPSVYDNFFNHQHDDELLWAPAVEYKAEGKLASYTVRMDKQEFIESYRIDYLKKELLLNPEADIWKRNIDIAGTNFEIVFKHGGKDCTIFCEVNPGNEDILLNWDHPMRATMGDTGYIKHCIASVAAGLPQEQLNTYVRLITSKF